MSKNEHQFHLMAYKNRLYSPVNRKKTHKTTNGLCQFKSGAFVGSNY